MPVCGPDGHGGGHGDQYLNPDCMIIGGGVPRMKCFPAEYLRERILFYTRKPFPAESLRLIFAEDEEDKSVAGAAIYAREKMKEYKNTTLKLI